MIAFRDFPIARTLWTEALVWTSLHSVSWKNLIRFCFEHERFQVLIQRKLLSSFKSSDHCTYWSIQLLRAFTKLLSKLWSNTYIRDFNAVSIDRKMKNEKSSTSSLKPFSQSPPSWASWLHSIKIPTRSSGKLFQALFPILSIFLHSVRLWFPPLNLQFRDVSITQKSPIGFWLWGNEKLFALFWTK